VEARSSSTLTTVSISSVENSGRYNLTYHREIQTAGTFSGVSLLSTHLLVLVDLWYRTCRGLRRFDLRLCTGRCNEGKCQSGSRATRSPEFPVTRQHWQWKGHGNQDILTSTEGSSSLHSRNFSPILRIVLAGNYFLRLSSQWLTSSTSQSD